MYLAQTVPPPQVEQVRRPGPAEIYSESLGLSPSQTQIRKRRSLSATLEPLDRRFVERAQIPHRILSLRGTEETKDLQPPSGCHPGTQVESNNQANESCGIANAIERVAPTVQKLLQQERRLERQEREEKDADITNHKRLRIESGDDQQPGSTSSQVQNETHSQAQTDQDRSNANRNQAPSTGERDRYRAAALSLPTPYAACIAFRRFDLPSSSGGLPPVCHNPFLLLPEACAASQSMQASGSASNLVVETKDSSLNYHSDTSQEMATTGNSLLAEYLDWGKYLMLENGARNFLHIAFPQIRSAFLSRSSECISKVEQEREHFLRSVQAANGGLTCGPEEALDERRRVALYSMYNPRDRDARYKSHADFVNETITRVYHFLSQYATLQCQQVAFNPHDLVPLLTDAHEIVQNVPEYIKPADLRRLSDFEQSIEKPSDPQSEEYFIATSLQLASFINQSARDPGISAYMEAGVGLNQHLTPYDRYMVLMYLYYVSIAYSASYHSTSIDNETFAYAVAYFDRYLTLVRLSEKEIYNLGMACLFLAIKFNELRGSVIEVEIKEAEAKHEECLQSNDGKLRERTVRRIRPPSIFELCGPEYRVFDPHGPGMDINADKVIVLEREVFTTLKCRLHITTPHHVVRKLFELIPPSFTKEDDRKMAEGIMSRHLSQHIIRLSEFFATLCYFIHDWLTKPQDILGVSAIIAAFQICNASPLKWLCTLYNIRFFFPDDIIYIKNTLVYYYYTMVNVRHRYEHYVQRTNPVTDLDESYIWNANLYIETNPKPESTPASKQVLTVTYDSKVYTFAIQNGPPSNYQALVREYYDRRNRLLSTMFSLHNSQQQ